MVQTVNSHSRKVSFDWSEDQLATCDAERASHYILTLVQLSVMMQSKGATEQDSEKINKICGALCFSN